MSKLAHISGVGKTSFSDLPQSFAEALRHSAENRVDSGVTLLDRSGKGGDRRSYAELLSMVEDSVGRWRSLGVRAGDRVLLCLPTSWDFIEAWLGLICLGAHPAAIANAAGGLGASSNFADRLGKYCAVIGAERIVIGDRMAQDLRDQHAEGVGRMVLTPDEVSSQEIGDRTLVESKWDDLAFLQFTSGSTGMPRAVKIEHGMAIHNSYAINEGIGRRFGAPVTEVAE
ncbi:MAG: AMP-binding protein, partial [Verrucomicrobiota bacterium]